MFLDFLLGSKNGQLFFSEISSSAKAYVHSFVHRRTSGCLSCRQFASIFMSILTCVFACVFSSIAMYLFSSRSRSISISMCISTYLRTAEAKWACAACNAV